METIAAIATAVGNSGIGIVRISGDKSFEIIKKIFIPKNKDKNIKGYTIKYGNIIDEKNNIIDEVLVSFFKKNSSYTMEDMCEINTHGGMVVINKVLEECLKNGARLAEPGEFTKRAFLNGRIDLSQAEGIIELINSKTEKEAKASIKQLNGGILENINKIKKELLNIMADIEVNIDYPEYETEEIINKKIIKILEKIKNKLINLNNSFETGKILKEGIKVAIIGKPNAGKSSLLNSILKEERAIVSDVEGTTRDTIEESISVRGIPIKIIDTAGIRETNDAIEEMGVNRSLNILNDADLIIAIFDNSKLFDEQDIKILEKIKNKKSIILLNKNDLIEKKENLNIIKKYSNKKILKISAKNKIGLEELYDEIEKMFNMNNLDVDNSIIITNIRHKNQIDKAIKNINNAVLTIDRQMPMDIFAIEIKQAIEDLSEITGDNVSESIIEEIFSKFCLGK